MIGPAGPNGRGGAALSIRFRAWLEAVMGAEAFGFMFQFWILIVLGSVLRGVHQQFVHTRETREKGKALVRARDAEEKRILLDGDPPQCRLLRLPKLTAFLGEYGWDPEYSREFGTPFRQALTCLRDEIQKRG